MAINDTWDVMSRCKKVSRPMKMFSENWNSSRCLMDCHKIAKIPQVSVVKENKNEWVNRGQAKF